MLALLVVGFGAFIAILYFLASGDAGAQDSNNGGAHAAAKGFNGYSALVELVEADGMNVDVSRNPSDLETTDLLVLTPPRFADPQELAKVIEAREYLGPTLVILPKWSVIPPNFLIEAEDEDDIEDGWVYYGALSPPLWADQAEGPLALGVARGPVAQIPAPIDEGDTAQPEPEAQRALTQTQGRSPGNGFTTRGQIRGISGKLPTNQGLFAKPKMPHIPLVSSKDGRPLALALRYDTEEYDAATSAEERDEIELAQDNWVVFLLEADLMNNWGLANRDRAKTALSIVRIMGDGYNDNVVFDLTLNGFGGTMNLLTLAFQPPFLAATICLLFAIFIVGWRAFLRFGPSTLGERGTAFGKARLVTNGADLIVRAGRFGLLAEPYIALNARRLARALALPRPDPNAIDEALAVRDPAAPSFTARADALRAASKPTDILRAARALNSQVKPS